MQNVKSQFHETTKYEYTHDKLDTRIDEYIQVDGNGWIDR